MNAGFTIVARLGSRIHLFKNHLASFVGVVIALPLVLSSNSWDSLGAESSPPPPTSSQNEEANAQALLHALSQLQEQLQATQLAIEQNRKEAKEAANQNSEALSNGIQTLQQAFSAQRAQDLEAMRRSNKVMLIVAGTFAAMGVLTLIMMTWFQWRMSKGLAEISAALLTSLGLGPGSDADALAPAGQPDLRLLRATEQPERRPHELEQGPHAALKRRVGISMAIENRLLSENDESRRRRQFLGLGMAVIVGLICALGIALLFYVVTYRKLGFL